MEEEKSLLKSSNPNVKFNVDPLVLEKLKKDIEPKNDFKLGEFSHTKEMAKDFAQAEAERMEKALREELKKRHPILNRLILITGLNILIRLTGLEVVRIPGHEPGTGRHEIWQDGKCIRKI